MRLFGKRMDERERMEMYKNEHYAFYFLYIALAGGLIVKTCFLQSAFRDYAWEWAVFLLVSIWLIAADCRRGNYDYFTEPGWKSYLLYSVVFTVIFTAIMILAGIYKGWIKTVLQGCIAGLTEFIFFFVLCYAALAFFGMLTKRRRRRLEEQFDDEE